MECEEEETYREVMRGLQGVWEYNDEILPEERQRTYGIRSSQIAALVLLLIKKGILK